MIAANHLRTWLDAPHPDFKKWYKTQVLAAHFLRQGIAKRASGYNSDIALLVPEAEEIVNETISRVLAEHNQRYRWDGQKPSTFSRFFAQCLKTTTNSMWAKERGGRDGRMHYGQSTIATTAHESAIFAHWRLEVADGGHRILASVIADTKMRDVTISYVHNLPRYVNLGCTTEEIAADLNVKKTTVSSVRKRVRGALDDPEKS